MKKIRFAEFAAITALIFLCTKDAGAQVEGSIFAPFVSHLEARTSPPSSVKLTWTDSPSVRGPVFIYRALHPFNGKPPRDTLCGEVKYGEKTWVDSAPHQGTFYYFVVSSDENAMPFFMIVPFNNMVEILLDNTSRMAQAAGFSAPLKNAAEIQVKPPQEETEERREAPALVFSPPAAVTVRQKQDTGVTLPQTATITGISAMPDGDRIRVSFVQLFPSKNAAVYRNITPMTKPGDILSADVVHLPGARSPVFDNVKTGVPYYYAVLYDEDIRAGNLLLIPGQNSTVYPALLYPARTQEIAIPKAAAASKLSIEAEAALSRKGLPPAYMPQTSAQAPPVYSQPGRPAQQGMTQPAISGSASAPVSVYFYIPEPQVFQQDLLLSDPSSDDYRLQSIVKTSFTWRNWNKAIADLQALIAANTSSQVETRARFYLGQAFVYTGNYNMALLEFRAVQSKLPAETNLWLQLSQSYISGSPQ